VLRTDIAYDSAKTFFSADTLNAVLRPAAQEVVGIEYQTGSFDKVIVLEAWAMQVMSPEVLYVPNLSPTSTSNLLFYQDQNFGVANIFRWGLFDNIIFDIRSTIGITPFWYLARPELGYEVSNWTLRAGFLGIGGGDGSLGRYYRRNSTAYVTTRLSF
jgi:hypothetical protein